MRKVIFICIVSLTVCLTKAAESQGPEPVKSADNAAKNQTLSSDPVSTNASQTPSTVVPTVPEQPITSKTTTNIIQTVLPDNQTSTTTTPPASKAAFDKNTTSNTVPSNKGSEVEIPKSATDNKISPPTVDPKTAGITESTTSKSENKTTTKPTEIPKIADKTVQARGFDGASFVGGIVLTLGLLTIGFMGFKYYKNQTERNYHTL